MPFCHACTAAAAAAAAVLFSIDWRRQIREQTQGMQVRTCTCVELRLH
jgi:hypothetical protein